jgi:hypothetical protein
VRFLKTVVAALAAFTAVPASATVIYADLAGINYESGNYYGGIGYAPLSFTTVGPAGRFLFNGNDINTNAAFSALTFCADLFRDVGTGLYAISPISLITLDATKQSQLAALLTHAAAAIDGAPNFDAHNATAAALQLAIWEVIYEQGTSSYTVESGDFYAFEDPSAQNFLLPLRAEADSYLANITNGSWTGSASQVSVLFSEVNQSQLFLNPGVPEPATWLTLVLGFVGVGVGTRASRPKRAVKTA